MDRITSPTDDAGPEKAAADHFDLNLLRDFAMAVTDVSGIIDEDGKTLALFRASDFPVYRPAEEIVGKLLEEALPAPVCVKIRDALTRALTYARLQQTEYELDLPVTGPRMMEIRLSPMRQTFAGKRAAAFKVTDITDRVRQERALRLSYQRRRKNHLFNDLISQRLTPSQAAFRGQQMGIDLLQPFSFYLLISPDPAGESRAAHADRITWCDLVHDCAEDFLRENNCVVWCAEDGVAILSPPPARGRELKAAETAFAAKLVEALRLKLPTVKVRVGIAGSLTTVANLGRSYRHALTAATTGKFAKNSEAVHHYFDIGIFQILATLPAEAETGEFVERTIGGLVAYDLEHKTDLVATLEEILLGDSLNEVARKLYLHPKTVLFRKRRIEEILAVSLDSFETRLSLATAFKLSLMRGDS